MSRSPRSTPIVRRLALCAVSVPICFASACATSDFAPPDPTRIDGAYVEEVVTTLAADGMRGRSAFSPDAMRAAEYLAEGMEEAGLTPLAGSDGFLQRFTVRQVRASGVDVTLDGRAVPSDRVAARLATPSLSWSTGDAPVVAVGEGDELQSALFGAVQGSDDALLIVHPSHEAAFARFAGFLRGASSILEGSTAPNVVAVLADGSADAGYEVSAAAEVTEVQLANVAGMLPGHRLNEFVLFSAHYDHIGIRPGAADSIANGANDNASGVAAVMALARYYAERGTPERTLLFTAFTAEEGGGFGSRYYSGQVDPDQIVAMFNIEMIGKPAVEGPNTAWITGFERSSFGPLLREAVAGTEYEFYPDPYPQQNLFYRSDNATLARLGVPAHSISTTPIDVDPDYHQVTDHVETLDLDHLTNTVRAIAMGAETMVTGAATPTRVDPATVN